MSGQSQFPARITKYSRNGAMVGFLTFLATHVIPYSGDRPAIEWIINLVRDFLGLTSNGVGALIYVLGFAVFPAIGFLLGRLIGGMLPAYPDFDGLMPGKQHKNEDRFGR